MSNHEDDDGPLYGEERQRGIRLVAWVVIIALVLAGGGAAIISLLPPL
jgi:hypothetical protein